ncbi:DNA photolyase [Desulfococcaceae bacterium HSG8]|nr:DNA photolyase [Desulfococcaceae bacterium HSG8]
MIIYTDQQVADTPEAKAVCSRLKVPPVTVQGGEGIFKAVSAANDPVRKGKTVLFLTRNRGAFIRKCPGTRDYTCCGYKILHIGTFCVMDCAYCILQSYFHPPVLQYFVNQHKMIAELDSLFSEKQVCRIGTGEFTDSMIWESWTDISRMLVLKFASQSHAVLELKTKTTAIETLKGLKHNRKTIVAWSLNTDRVIRKEERGTTSLSARLRAAARCESWGYPLAFHFDPLFIYEGCEAEYSHVIEQIFSHVSAKNIVWISLGTFRFMPSLKPIIQKRFPDSKIIYGEFIPGTDGKMRYFKPLRIRLYQHVISSIKKIAPDVLIYFCMEDDEVWEKSLGFIPGEHGGLPEMLDESAVTHCDLDFSLP